MRERDMGFDKGQSISNLEIANRFKIIIEIKKTSAKHFSLIRDVYDFLNPSFSQFCHSISQVDLSTAEVLQERLTSEFSQSNWVNFNLKDKSKEE